MYKRGSPSTAQPAMAAQGDMMQARWESHGDYEPIALSPSSVQNSLILQSELLTYQKSTEFLFLL